MNKKDYLIGDGVVKRRLGNDELEEIESKMVSFMKMMKLGKHEQACWDEVVLLDIDTSKIRSLCKKARKLDEEGVSFPLPKPNLYFEYWDIRKTARERKMSKAIRKNQEIYTMRKRKSRVG